MKMCGTQQAAKSPNTQAYIWLCRSQRPRRGSCRRAFASARVDGRKRIRGRGAALLSADALSPFRGLTLRGDSLFSPVDTLHLSENTDESQNTLPLEPFGCWRGPSRWLTCAAFGKRGRAQWPSFSRSVRNNTETGWLSVSHSHVYPLRKPAWTSDATLEKKKKKCICRSQALIKRHD